MLNAPPQRRECGVCAGRDTPGEPELARPRIGWQRLTDGVLVSRDVRGPLHIVKSAKDGHAPVRLLNGRQAQARQDPGDGRVRVKMQQQTGAAQKYVDLVLGGDRRSVTEQLRAPLDSLE